MAAVTVEADVIRVHDMGDTDGVTGVSSIGGGAGAGAEPDFVYQGSNSVSRKIGSGADNGFEVSISTLSPSSIDMSAGSPLSGRPFWIAKFIATNNAALLHIRLRFGSSSSDYYEMVPKSDPVYSANTDYAYPDVGGWQIAVVKPDQQAMKHAPTGAPDLTAVSYFAITGRFGDVSKSENLALDAIDIGYGMTITGGNTSPETPGSFQDFVDTDEGDQTNGKWGFFSTIGSIIRSLGMHWIGRDSSGSTQATIFEDSGRVLLFPGFAIETDDIGFRFDLGNSGTRIVWDGIVTVSNGVPRWRMLIQLSAIPSGTQFALLTGSPEIESIVGMRGVGIYFRQVGGLVDMLTSPLESPGGYDISIYHLHDARVRANTVELMNASVFQSNGLVVTSSEDFTYAVDLQGPYSGDEALEEQIMEVANNNQPSFIATGTSGSLAYQNCTFNGVANFVLTSAVDVLNCTFRQIESMQQNGGTIDGCSFIGHIGNWVDQGGGGMLESDDPELISNCSFDRDPTAGYDDLTLTYFKGSQGHAIRITTPGTYTFTGNTFTNYEPAATEKQTFSTDAITASTDSPANTITIPGHGYSDGDGVIYARDGGSIDIGLTDNQIYYVGVIDANTIRLYTNEGIAKNFSLLTSELYGDADLAASSSPAETHALYSPFCAIWNDSGGQVTLNISDGDIPSVRNTSGSPNSTTTVNSSVSVTITGLQPGTEVRVYEHTSPISTTELGGVESVGSPAEFTFSAAAGTVVDIVIFHIDYVLPPANRIKSYTVPASNTSFPVTQILDRNYSNP